MRPVEELIWMMILGIKIIELNYTWKYETN